MTESRQRLDSFRAFLTRKGLKLTRQRLAIGEAFYGSEQHLSLQELTDRSKVHEPSIGFATVYRTMRLLVEGGLAVEHQFSDGHARYEPAVDGEHHDHLICVQCGWILEFEDPETERRQDRIAAAHDMRVRSHRHEIYADCLRPECDRRAR